MKAAGIIPFPLGETESRVKFAVQVLQQIGPKLLQMREDYFSHGSSERSGYPEKVTQICRHVEQSLYTHIQKKFNRDNFFTYAPASHKSGDFQWWIEPLDGQSNFTHRVPHFSSSIGICFRGAPIGAAVYIPNSQDTYYAVRGEGAFKNSKPITVSKVDKLEDALTASGLPYKDQRKAALSEILANISVFINSGTGLRRSGSAIIDICWIAEGIFDAFWERSFKSQSLCTVLVILEEAGGQVSSFSGKKLEVSNSSAHSFDLLASNAALHTSLVKLMKQVPNVEGIN